jgi:hypothetical protein
MNLFIKMWQGKLRLFNQLQFRCVCPTVVDMKRGSRFEIDVQESEPMWKYEVE